MLPEVIAHLNRHGVDVHIFDNWSTDGSFELAQAAEAQRRCKSVKRFPDAPSPHYEWAAQLRNVEAYAGTLDADWVIHYDADELRLPPWRSVTLQQGISFVDMLGYSAIDFTLLNFRFTSGQKSQAPYEQHLQRFEFGTEPGHFVQVKAWKNQGQAVDIATSGGHSVEFAGRRVFPLNFLTKHYPLRSPEQAKRKVFWPVCHVLPRKTPSRDGTLNMMSLPGPAASTHGLGGN